MSLLNRVHCRVVLLDRNNRPVGCGFICGPRHVMTCTHVVCTALGNPPGEAWVGKTLAVSFAADRTTLADMKVIASHPVAEGLLADISLLELCEGNAFPASFTIAGSILRSITGRLQIAGVGINVLDEEVQIEGPTGQYAGLNRVFVRAVDNSHDVSFQPGCSGTAVFDDNYGLVGMAAQRQADVTGFIIPIQILRQVWRLAETTANLPDPITKAPSFSTIPGDAYRAAYAGSPFQYDVYISYARGETHEVAKRIAETIADVREVIHSGFKLDTAFATAFTESKRTHDDAISHHDRAVVASSALLLVLLSAKYLNAPACRAELDAFLEQAKKDGRTSAHVVLCMMEVVAIDSARLPPGLAEGDRTITTARKLYGHASRSDLCAAVAGLVGEISTKLKAFHKQIAAVTSAGTVPLQEGVLADQLYLHSHRDQATWERTKTLLESESFIVMPVPMEQDDAVIDVPPERSAMRRSLLSFVDGYVLIRDADDDPVLLQAGVGLHSRRRSTPDRPSGRPPGWVLLNWVEDDGPPGLSPNMRLPCVPVAPPGLRDRVRAGLGLSKPAES